MMADMTERPFASSLLAGKTALVTGGGTGLGRAIAEGLSGAGADVVIAARRKERLDVAAAEISAATGNPVDVDLVDIRDRSTIEALAGRHDVDILVNNAGGQFPQKARDYSPNGWNSVIDLNLNGTWAMTQVFGNQMLDGHGGNIVQIVAIVDQRIVVIEANFVQIQVIVIRICFRRCGRDYRHHSRKRTLLHEGFWSVNIAARRANYGVTVQIVEPLVATDACPLGSALCTCRVHAIILSKVVRWAAPLPETADSVKD